MPQFQILDANNRPVIVNRTLLMFDDRAWPVKGESGYDESDAIAFAQANGGVNVICCGRSPGIVDPAVIAIKIAEQEENDAREMERVEQLAETQRQQQLAIAAKLARENAERQKQQEQIALEEEQAAVAFRTAVEDRLASLRNPREHAKTKAIATVNAHFDGARLTAESLNLHDLLEGVEELRQAALQQVELDFMSDEEKKAFLEAQQG